jgi:hypothetical protein
MAEALVGECTGQKLSQVGASLAELSNQIGQAKDRLAMLANRLSIVMLPENPPQTSCDKALAGGKAQVALEIDGYSEGVQDIRLAIDHIIDRLAI